MLFRDCDLRQFMTLTRHRTCVIKYKYGGGSSYRKTNNYITADRRVWLFCVSRFLRSGWCHNIQLVFILTLRMGTRTKVFDSVWDKSLENYIQKYTLRCLPIYCTCTNRIWIHRKTQSHSLPTQEPSKSTQTHFVASLPPKLFVLFVTGVSHLDIPKVWLFLGFICGFCTVQKILFLRLAFDYRWEVARSLLTPSIREVVKIYEFLEFVFFFIFHCLSKGRFW